MKINNNKTLEQLDMQEFDNSSDSNLINTINQLRKKPIKNFTVEDLRVVIGQNLNLEIFIPIAIEKLKENILIEGDFYSGDLLKNVLDSDLNYWSKNKEYWLILKQLYKDNIEKIEVENNKQIFKSFVRFENI